MVQTFNPNADGVELLQHVQKTTFNMGEELVREYKATKSLNSARTGISAFRTAMVALRLKTVHLAGSSTVHVNTSPNTTESISSRTKRN